jgi:hypothetical protein
MRYSTKCNSTRERVRAGLDWSSTGAGRPGVDIDQERTQGKNSLDRSLRPPRLDIPILVVLI